MKENVETEILIVIPQIAGQRLIGVRRDSNFAQRTRSVVNFVPGKLERTRYAVDRYGDIASNKHIVGSLQIATGCVLPYVDESVVCRRREVTHVLVDRVSLVLLSSADN
jgi:hypothetical protein